MAHHSTGRLDAAAERLGDPTLWGRVGLRSFLIGVIIVVVGVLFGISLTPGATLANTVVTTVSGQILDFPPLPDDLEEPWQRSVVTDRRGGVLAVLRDENRKVVELSQVPEHVRQAVVATEDSDFYRHEGVSWTAILRAAAGNVAAGEITSGASTITQQIIKNVVVGDDVTLNRKLQEAVYAIELEERLSKDEILEVYLNEAYFANRVYGIGTAAEFYWGKDVSELTLAEGALLAGVIRLPEGNEPVDHPDAAIARRDIVLDQMVRADFITADQAATAKQEPLELNVRPLRGPRSPFFVDYVRTLLRQEPALGQTPEARELRVLRGGLTIRTTLHPQLQRIAGESIESVLDGSDDPLGALTSVDPRSGQILAVGFGPKEYGKGPGEVAFNPAVPGLGGSGRQPGSAFKAFEIVAALESGISPGHTFDAGATYTHESPACPGAQVGNYADASQGVLDMAAATAVSSNTYFAHLLDLTGPEKLVETANRMGIDSELDAFCSTVLGTSEVFPLEMASAFGTLANGGAHCEPYAILEIRDRSDRVISRGGEGCEQVVEEAVAARATELLRGPIENGTASRNGQIGRPAAGKTGTTDDYLNAWFVGYIPQLSAAAWVGHEIPTEMTHEDCGGNVTGGCLPTMIWQRFMTAAVEALELEVRDFPDPPPLPISTVPNVVGMTEDDAVEVLEEADFRAEVVVEEDYRPEGEVFEQSPAGGAEAPEGSIVYLAVSDGTGDPPPTEEPTPETDTAETDDDGDDGDGGGDDGDDGDAPGESSP